jgi:hypothetical protein
LKSLEDLKVVISIPLNNSKPGQSAFMVPSVRSEYNRQFTEDKYQAYVLGLQQAFPGHLDFRIAETPVFVPKDFTQKMLDACTHILHTIGTARYREQSSRAIPDHLRVPDEDEQPDFIAFDFGVCLNDAGELEPRLIELQGFPTLFAWQVIQAEVHHKHFWWPPDYSIYLSGLDRDSYLDLFRKIAIGEAHPEEVILLEVFPHQQKTRVDFYATERFLGIRTVCLTDLIVEGRDVFYEHEGKKIQVKRIYNRVIFDDLFQQPNEVREKGRLFQQPLNVKWVPHPNWFYRVSKFTLPFIQHAYVPETRFLDKHQLPDDLEHYVVKPLFSFAGQGVIIDVTREEVARIPDPENWIIQRKVRYADAIQTPGEPAKTEIRLFYFRDPESGNMIPACNLSRLSKGKMIGVRYNKDKDWVGGSFCLFEK